MYEHSSGSGTQTINTKKRLAENSDSESDSKPSPNKKLKKQPSSPTQDTVKLFERAVTNILSVGNRMISHSVTDINVLQELERTLRNGIETVQAASTEGEEFLNNLGKNLDDVDIKVNSPYKNYRYDGEPYKEYNHKEIFDRFIHECVNISQVASSVVANNTSNRKIQKIFFFGNALRTKPRKLNDLKTNVEERIRALNGNNQ